MPFESLIFAFQSSPPKPSFPGVCLGSLGVSEQDQKKASEEAFRSLNILFNTSSVSIVRVQYHFLEQIIFEPNSSLNVFTFSFAIIISTPLMEEEIMYG